MRYREQHLRPYDGALRLLLAGDPGIFDIAEIVWWSARRKAVALALGLGKAVTMQLPEPAQYLERLELNLATDEALIDYIVIPDVAAAVVITRAGANVIRLALSPGLLERDAKELRRPFTAVHQGRVDLARAPYDLGLAMRIANAVVRPVISGINERRLVLVPDGALHYIPFEALPLSLRENDAGNQYMRAEFLADRYETVYLLSTRFLKPAARRQVRPGGRGPMLLAALDVPGGDAEVAAVTRYWKDTPLRVLVRREATETAVRRAWTGAELIHIAAHASADGNDPMQSHLSLQPDVHNDGLLHITEVIGSQLNARLVVLSACETMPGRLYQGEGLMGLARAFQVAGAETVIATRWPIGAETAAMMDRFYSALSAGKVPSTALREARLTVRKNSGTGHPFYWAGFVVTTGG